MIRHQVKSKWYYVFWGIATIAVCSGQLYVGSGYREMAAQQQKLSETLKENLSCQNSDIPKYLEILEKLL